MLKNTDRTSLSWVSVLQLAIKEVIKDESATSLSYLRRRQKIQ